MDPTVNNSVRLVERSGKASSIINDNLDPSVVNKLKAIREKIFKDFTSYEEGTILNKNPFDDTVWIEEMASKLASATALTFGPGICNYGISAACALLYPKPVKDPTTWEKWTKTGAHFAVDAITVGAQLAITPYLLPFLPLLASGVAIGGVKTIAFMSSAAYVGCYGREIKAEFPPLNELIKFDEASGNFVNAHGTPYNEQTLTNLFAASMKFSLVCKLQECKRSQVEEVINQYVKLVEINENTSVETLDKVKAAAKALTNEFSSVCVVGLEELIPHVNVIVSSIARHENKKLMFTAPQLLKISEAFDHLHDFLDVPLLNETANENEKEKVYWESHSSKICKRGGDRIWNRAWNRLNGLSTTNACSELKKNLQQNLINEFKNIDAELENIIRSKNANQIEEQQELSDPFERPKVSKEPLSFYEIDSDIKDFIKGRLKTMHQSFENFNRSVGNAHKGARLQAVVEELYNDFKQLENKLIKNLTEKKTEKASELFEDQEPFEYFSNPVDFNKRLFGIKTIDDAFETQKQVKSINSLIENENDFALEIELEKEKLYKELESLPSVIAKPDMNMNEELEKLLDEELENLPSVAEIKKEINLDEELANLPKPPSRPKTKSPKEMRIKQA